MRKFRSGQPRDPRTVSRQPTHIGKKLIKLAYTNGYLAAFLLPRWIFRGAFFSVSRDVDATGSGSGSGRMRGGCSWLGWACHVGFLIKSGEVGPGCKSPRWRCDLVIGWFFFLPYFSFWHVSGSQRDKGGWHHWHVLFDHITDFLLVFCKVLPRMVGCHGRN